MLVLNCKTTNGIKGLSYRWEKDGLVLLGKSSETKDQDESIKLDHIQQHSFGPYGIGITLAPLSGIHNGSYSCIASSETYGDLFKTSMAIQVKEAAPLTTGSGSKVVLVGGTASSSLVLDLDQSNLKCPSWPAIPFTVAYGTTGDLINGSKAFVCGGGNYDREEPNLGCYILGEPGVQANLSTARHFAAGLTVGSGDNEVLWVTGGSTDIYNTKPIQSTEFIKPGEPSKPGPDLPRAMEQHCLLRIDANIVMLIDIYGNRSSHYINTSNLGGQSWILGPRIPSKYDQVTVLSCGVFLDLIQSNLKIVALVTERFILVKFQDSNIWQKLDLNPMLDLDDIAYSYSVYDTTEVGGDGLYVIGHRYHTRFFVRKLECSNRKCAWQNAGARQMPFLRDYDFMFMINKQVPQCTRQ